MPTRRRVILLILAFLFGFSLISCSQKREPIDASMVGKEVVCPVTGEKFRITKNTAFVDYQGKRYYFCCPGCDKRFLENPEKYIVKEDVKTSTQNDKTDIKYWTCSMHPSVHADKTGKCPICGMDLIPVYQGSENLIKIDSEKVEMLGIKTEPAEKRHLIKRISLPARVVKDEELYTLQQELKTADSEGKGLLSAVYLKLKQLGFSSADIDRMRSHVQVDESLILPNPERAWLMVEVFEQDIRLIKKGQKASIKFDAYPDKEFAGKISAIETKIDPMTRSTKARIMLHKPGVKLYTDMYAEAVVEIPIGEVLSIPTKSLIDTGRRKLVYVQKNPGQYELRNVVTGAEAEEYVQITEGLNEGEHVVAEGNFLLDSQTTLAGGQALLYGAVEEVKEKYSEQPHKH